MKLVLDTNILIAALVKDSITREILVHPNMEFIIPEFAFEEIEINRAEILAKSGLSEDRLALLLEKLKDNIRIIPMEEIMFWEEAKLIMDKIDPEDTVFIALAMSTDNEGLWTQDKHFLRQNKTKIFTTEEIVKRLGIEHD